MTITDFILLTISSVPRIPIKELYSKQYLRRVFYLGTLPSTTLEYPPTRASLVSLPAGRRVFCSKRRQKWVFNPAHSEAAPAG